MIFVVPSKQIKQQLGFMFMDIFFVHLIQKVINFTVT